MAAVTTNGPWPITDLTTGAVQSVYAGPYLRATTTNPSAARWLFPARTTFPATPAPTSYPTAP